MIDHFKKLKNLIVVRLKKIEKSTERSIGPRKSISRSQKIDQAIDQTIKDRKMENRMSLFYLLLLKIEKVRKKIDCFPTDQSKMIDHRFLIGITKCNSG